MKILRFLFIFLFPFSLTLSANNHQIKPPIPEKPMSVLEELKYIFRTDQEDRKFWLDTTKPINLSTLQRNDSIRFQRVLRLDSLGLIMSDVEKYYAAFIYMHNSYYNRGIELCDEILKSPKDEQLVDTISSKNISEVEEKIGSGFLDIFDTTALKELKGLLPKEKIFVPENSQDTFFIISIPLKRLARSLKISMEMSRLQKPKSLDIMRIDDPVYIKEAKEIIKSNILNSILQDTPYLIDHISEEKLNNYVDFQIELVKKFRDRLLEEIQKNPQKFLKEDKK